MNEPYFIVDKCRCCGNQNLVDVLDLTDQPPANSYWSKGEQLPDRFPLKLQRCSECFHAQLNVVVDPNILFKQYAYMSGISKTLQDYFEWFAEFVMVSLKSQDSIRTKRILDIASNDGSQLKAFQKHGVDVQGVDPAENLAKIANDNGVPTLCDFWSSRVAKEMGIRFDAIIAQNVFAHVHDVLDFLLGVKEVMHDRSILFIQTSQANMFERNEFDTIYHEHLSFFNSKSMKAICERAGLRLSGVLKTNIHGTSYVFMVTKGELFKVENVNESIASETKKGIYSPETYVNFAENAKKITSELKKTIEDYREQGYYTVGLGAAAKGMTVLNFGNIKLDFVVDETPTKINKFTPGSNIPIYGMDSVRKLTAEKVVFIPLAWNFFDEIREKIKTIRPDNKDIFIKYFPKVEIINE